MCGSVDLYDPMCRRMANEANAIVVSTEYRLAPEFQYPIGLNDCKAMLVNHREVLAGVNHLDTFYVAGDSAGGAISSTLGLSSGVGKMPTLAGQILIYPSLDYTMQSDSIKENGSGFLLESDRIAWYFDHYFDAAADRRVASPLFADLSDVPPTLIFTAGCDPLRDEGQQFVRRLTAQGVDVNHYQFDGMIHAFMNIEDLVTDECDELYQHIARFVNK